MADLQIANTIKEQLYAFGKVKVWSWGAHAWVGGTNFLRFRVQGHHFRGIVKITLNSMDLYDIEFIKGETVVKEINGVYFDEMTDIIDRYVEKIEAYKD
jgi:hypothetical protein